MHYLLHKKSLFVLIFVLMMIFCLTIFCMPFSVKAENNSTIEDFYQFENKFLDLLNDENNVTDNESSFKTRSFSSDKSISENSTFALKRLIVIGEIEYYYGATNVINGYKNYNILSFNSEEDTAYAYEQLSKNKNITVIIDQEIHINDYADNNYSYPVQGTWGAQAMNVGGINDYLQTHGTDQEVVVAVLDSGIRPTHIFFRNRILENNGQLVGYSYYQSTNMGQYSFEDDNGHGSHVSGIITQLTPENVKILPIKVLNNEGSGTFTVVILALEKILEVYSQDYNICCINMSLGGLASTGTSTLLNNLFNQLKDKEILSIVSAGNDQLDTSMYMPANCESAIVVSSIKEKNNIYSFDHSYSNFGSTIDISAPGSNILSAYYTGDSVGVYMSGTSMASPHVSAAVALLCCDEIYWDGSTPMYTDEIIEKRLYENTVDLGDYGWDEFYGHGMVDLKYFNIELSRDILTFCNEQNQEVDVSDYVLFNESYKLQVKAPDSSYEIYYTTDGTIPTRSSNLYTSMLTITSSDIYYFIAYKVVNNSITESSILYKVDLFDPNDDIDDFFVNEKGVLIEYTGHFKELEIPNVIDGIVVSELGIRLFDNNEIESLILPDSCTIIGEYCFSDCANLQNINFSNITKIASYAFQNCQSLTEINVDKVQRLGEKTNHDILGHVFENCKSLNEIYLPNLITIGESTFLNSSVKMVAIGKSFTTTYGEGVGEGITIYGYTGSKAEEYCNNYGNTFVPIDNLAFTSNLPSTKEVGLGDIESLQISAQGLRLSYQWYKTTNDIADGVAIKGETNSTIKIDTVLLSTTKYFVKVTDWEGNLIISTICTVTVVSNGLLSVAQIFTTTGWNYYETLEQAIASSLDNDVIVVTQDCCISEFLFIDNDITIISVNNSTIYINEVLLNNSQPILTVQENITLTIGYNQSSYQGINVTPIYIDGQLQKGNVGTFIELSINSNLYIQNNAQIQNFCANKLIDGNSGSNLVIQGGKITNNKENFTTANKYLIFASNITLNNGTQITYNNTDDGALIYVNNSNLTINDVNFIGNNANYLILSNLNSQITINGGNFEDNICNSLINFSVASEIGNLSVLKLLGGTSQNNTTLNSNVCYDVYITDENLNTSYTFSQKSIQIGANCNFTNIYLNNTAENIAITVVENLVASQSFNIEISNEDNYLNNPIVIFESGINVSPSNFTNKDYNFVNKDENQPTYLFLKEKNTYIFTYIISESESVVQNYKSGDRVVKIANPISEKYDFIGWYEEPECINEYIFDIMPEHDVIVYAKWEIKTFVIIASNGDNGQISPNGEIDINYGESQKFIFISNQGYYVSKIIVDGLTLTNSNLENAIENGYTFSNVTKNHEIYVEFEIKLFTITSQSNIYGTITPNGVRTYRYGQNATYIIMPNEGYHIKSILVDSSLVNESEFENILKNGYKFNDIASSHTITVEFAINIYTIYSNSIGKGTISPEGEMEFEYGQSQTYIFLPNTGYHVSRITIDEVELSLNEIENVIENGYTFENICQDHKISVEFDIATYILTYDLNYDTNDIKESYEYNSKIDEFIPIRNGYNFIGWYKDIDLQEKYNFSLMPPNNLTVYAKWEIIIYKINATTNGNGSITPSGEIEKEFDSSVTYYFTPDEGYYLSSIIIDGQTLTKQQISQVLSIGYTFSNIDCSHDIQAIFEIYKFKINLIIEGNGKFYSNQDIKSVEYGDERVFTIDTDYDKYSIEVYVNGKLISEDESKTLKIGNIKENLYVNVRFIEKPFFETEIGKIVLIVVGAIAGIILISLPLTYIVKRKRLYSDMNKY